MNKLLIISFVAIIIFTRCETVVDIDVPLEPAKLVVNSTLIPGKPFKVHLSKSQHILDDSQYKNVAGAEIKIYENDQLLTTLPDSAYGNYISATFMPKSGKKYRIEASKNNFETVNAVETLPSKAARVISVKVDTIEVNDFGYIDQRLQFSVEIDDDATESYYELIIYKEYYHYDYDYDYNPPVKLDSTLYFDTMWLESADPGLEEYQSYGQSIFFDDGLFNGKKYHMKASSSFYGSGNGGVSQDVSYIIVLRNASKAYYLYKKSTELQDWTDGDPFAQPVQVYNNITNGYGIFAGYNNEMNYKIILD